MPPSPVASCARASHAAAPRIAASSDGRLAVRLPTALRIRHAATDGFQKPEDRSRAIARMGVPRSVSQNSSHQSADGETGCEPGRFYARGLDDERIVAIAGDEEIGERLGRGLNLRTDAAAAE